jgi:hypothetical protein
MISLAVCERSLRHQVEEPECMMILSSRSRRSFRRRLTDGLAGDEVDAPDARNATAPETSSAGPTGRAAPSSSRVSCPNPCTLIGISVMTPPAHRVDVDVPLGASFAHALVKLSRFWRRIVDAVSAPFIPQIEEMLMIRRRRSFIPHDRFDCKNELFT